MSDQREVIEAAISRYLQLFDRQPGDVGLRDLASALDGLVAAYFKTADIEPISEYPIEAPAFDEAAFAAKAFKLFPELQFYWKVDPEGEATQKIGGGFPEADLAEIAKDLSDVLWGFDHESEADAVWEFRFGYQTHWGPHVHELRNYVHVRGGW